MNKEIQDLNIKAKRKIYYLKKTYGLENLFDIKTEFKNEKQERKYIKKLKEFLFSSKYKYIRGGKIISYRKKDYGREYFYPIKKDEWKKIQRLIRKCNKAHAKQRNKKCNERYFSKFSANRKSIISDYGVKQFIKALEVYKNEKNKKS